MAPHGEDLKQIWAVWSSQYAGSNKYLCLRNNELYFAYVTSSLPFISHWEECTAIEYFLHLWRHLKMKFELQFQIMVKT